MSLNASDVLHILISLIIELTMSRHTIYSTLLNSTADMSISLIISVTIINLCCADRYCHIFVSNWIHKEVEVGLVLDLICM